MASKVSPDLIISPELDYKPLGYKHPQYRFQSIPQQSGGTTVSIPATGTVESIFQLPAKALSLSESFLTATLTPTAPGAGNYNWFFEHAPVIGEIYLYTSSFKYLAQISNGTLINYQVVTRPYNTPYEEYMTNDSTERLYPIDSAGAAGTDDARYNNDPAASPYFDPKVLKIGTIATATPVMNIFMKLGQIKDTIFSMKKTFLFPDIMYLRIVWGPAQKFSFLSTAAVPQTGAAVPAGPVAVTNMYFNAAIETDMEVVNGLQQQINSGGITMPIPYLSVVRQNLPSAGAGGVHTVQVLIGPNYGQKIKKIIWAPFNNTETGNVAVDHSNVFVGAANVASTVTSYQTFLDSNPLQIKSVNCIATNGSYDDYQLHKHVLKGTALSNRNIYQFHWFHQDDWSSLPISAQKLIPAPPENLVSGLDVGTGKTWSVAAVMTQANAYNHYVFIVGYKTMVIQPNNVDIM